jgi:hypothetical protein
MSARSPMRRRTCLDRERLHQQSHLFTVRLWQEELGNDQAEWRGKVQHITSDEVRYFRDVVSVVHLVFW